MFEFGLLYCPTAFVFHCFGTNTPLNFIAYTNKFKPKQKFLKSGNTKKRKGWIVRLDKDGLISIVSHQQYLYVRQR